jgi:DNA polymerase (family 10)
MDNRLVNIIAHPTGRLIGQRSAYDVDFERLVHAAADRGCALEVNGQPDRLDLNDVQARLAKEAGVRLSLATDAHSPAELRFMRYAVDQARRGWVEAKHALNCLAVEDLRRVLRR